MKLPEWGVQKPVTTLMFFLAIFMLGAVMVTQLPVDLMPEIERPTVTVPARKLSVLTSPANGSCRCTWLSTAPGST